MKPEGILERSCAHPLREALGHRTEHGSGAGMMRPSNALPVVYLCREFVDFRKGMNGLAVLVEEALRHDPFSEQLFVFCNRRRDSIKILYWERSGFCLWQKRLERARFKSRIKGTEGLNIDQFQDEA